jgi:hypothetical protein
VCTCVSFDRALSLSHLLWHLPSTRLALPFSTDIIIALQKRRIHLCHDIRAAISKSAHSSENKDEGADVHDKDWTAYRRLPQYLATISSTHGSDSVAVASAVVSATCCLCLPDMSKHVSCDVLLLCLISVILL